MDGVTHVLRMNTWVAIALALLVTAGLVAIGQTQMASLLGCIAGILLMWKSEINNPSTPAVIEEP